jgi:hypothetical protein
MTICFPDTQQMALFFQKCTFDNVTDRDRCCPIFDEINTLTCFTQVNVRTSKTTADVEAILIRKKVRYNWISPY